MALYGDPPIPYVSTSQVPYRGAGTTSQMELYNKALSAVRMSVEWLFGDIVNYFKFLDFKKNSPLVQLNKCTLCVSFYVMP